MLDKLPFRECSSFRNFKSKYINSTHILPTVRKKNRAAEGFSDWLISNLGTVSLGIHSVSPVAHTGNISPFIFCFSLISLGKDALFFLIGGY